MDFSCISDTATIHLVVFFNSGALDSLLLSCTLKDLNSGKYFVLIIDSILIPLEDSINTQALQHERAMVDIDEYTKIKPDSFKLQLQAVLTAFKRTSRGLKRQRLPQDQDCQALIRGPRGRQNNARGRDLHQHSRSAGSRRCSCCPPAGGEEPAAAPVFAEPAPAQSYRRRDGVVRGLRADED